MTTDPNVVGGRYALLEEIGAGPVTVVYRARDEVLARIVAVKVLRREIAAVDSLRNAFQARTVTAAGLSHPHIAAVYDTGAETIDGQSCPFIVMEYCEAGTLADAETIERFNDPASVATIGVALCDALEFAHGIDVVHGGIKPSNVLIAADGTPKLADFGVARESWYEEDPDDEASAYVAPERNGSTPAPPAADIYSVGAVLYALASGRHPRPAEDGLPPLRAVRAGVPRTLSDTIGRALSSDPDRRWSSPSQMRNLLRSDQPTSTIEMVPGHGRRAPEEAPERPPERAWWVPVGLILVFAIVAAIALPALLDDSRRSAGDTRDGNGTVGGSAVEVASVGDLDPYGDGDEHGDEAGAAIDGDLATSWSTEIYRSSFEILGKPGVGLVFDLGSPVEVVGVEIDGRPGSDVAVYGSDEPGPDETAYERIGILREMEASASLRLDEPVTFRYWLVWITRLPEPSGGQASIAEVRFLGS